MSRHAVSPLDGRYADKVNELTPIVSEFGLMKYRVITMASWVIFLEKQGVVEYNYDVTRALEKVMESFSDQDFERIKELERTTNHDVKAVEYFLREKLDVSVWPWIHFACTSEDVNNVAYAFMLADTLDVCQTALNEVIADLVSKAHDWRETPMLSRTHGQPATPTTVGKEMAVFVHRLNLILQRLRAVPATAKWSGATGNFAAHVVAFPKIDWQMTSMAFIESLGFTWNPLTTQIESHDMMSAVLNDIGQICGVLVDLCSDEWGYISIEYQGQKVVKTETGSSTMPGKVNPIDFENARSNFKMARGMARTIAEELPVSTWQRDLSDSTIQRNLGSVFAYYLLALKNLKRGLGKVVLREDVLRRELNRHPEVLGEAIQTVLRKHGHADAYEQLKDLLRGNRITLRELRGFVEKLDIPAGDKARLLALRPADYVGLSADLVDHM